MWWKLDSKEDCKYANRKRAESPNWMWLVSSNSSFTGIITSVTRRVPLMEQELFINVPLISSVFCVVFCWLLFVVSSLIFFFFFFFFGQCFVCPSINDFCFKLVWREQTMFIVNCCVSALYCSNGQSLFLNQYYRNLCISQLFQ